MKKTAIFIGFLVALTPAFAFAQTPSCSDKGYTVVFVNGIFDTFDQANTDKDRLKDTFGPSFNNEHLNFRLGYNPTHLAGAGDLLQSGVQLTGLFGGSISNFDLNTVLLQIYPEVNTRKLLLVGHSQGAFYTNDMYSYLTAHGEPTDAINLYNVASPASYTAGQGKYINSSNDTLLESLRLFGVRVLPSNVDIPAGSIGDLSGHGFVEDYLSKAGDRILADIGSEMNALKPTNATATGDCFTPPDQNLGYKTQAALFAVADPTATVLKVGAATTLNASTVVLKAATTFAVGIMQLLSDTIVVTVAPPTDEQKVNKTFNITNKLYGSSLDGLDAKDKQELLGNSQGAAVVLATKPTPTPKPGIVEGASTGPVVPPSIFPQTSNGFAWPGGGAASSPTIVVANTPEPLVVEVIEPTILFDASTTAPVLSVAECAHSLSADFCLVPSTSATLSWSTVVGAKTYNIQVNGTNISSVSTTSAVVTLQDQTTSTVTVSAVDASSTALTSNSVSVHVFTSPVVINEVQWAGDLVRSSREWVELKNRTHYNIDLSSLVLAATDGGSQYIPLVGTVYDNDFFVVERVAGAPLVARYAQVFNFDSLLDTGEQLTLSQVTNSGTTTLDQTPLVSTCNGWCAGSTVEWSGIKATLSMERINAEQSGTLASNWASNDTYTNSANMPDGNGQALYATPLQENSTHLPAVGWFCSTRTDLSGTGQLLVPGVSGQVAHTLAPNSTCNYFDRYILYPSVTVGAIFKGEVGSSTLVNMKEETSPGVVTQYYQGDHIDLSTTQPGDTFFVAIWERGGGFHDPGASASFVSYFTTGHRLLYNSSDGSFTVADDTDAPNDTYKIIPFTFQP